MGNKGFRAHGCQLRSRGNESDSPVGAGEEGQKLEHLAAEHGRVVAPDDAEDLGGHECRVGHLRRSAGTFKRSALHCGWPEALASSGTMVTGAPLSKTALAASGSVWMLNSLAGEVLPTPIQPPWDPSAAPPVSQSKRKMLDNRCAHHEHNVHHVYRLGEQGEHQGNLRGRRGQSGTAGSARERQGRALHRRLRW